jgi:hypothetical protein
VRGSEYPTNSLSWRRCGVAASRSRFFAVGLVLGIGFVGQNAIADDSAERAETLFQRARERMGQGDFAAACPMLQQAYSLDHGAGTLLALALCHEGSGRPATALREYRDSLRAAVQSNRPDRVMLAESHVQELEASVPRIKLRPPLPEPLGLAVTLDGAPIDRATMIAGSPVDPGVHVIVASARGSVTWRTSVDVGTTSAPAAIEIPPLADLTAAMAGRPSHAERTVGWIASGVGGAAVGAAGVFGVLAFDAEARSKHECANNRCSQNGVNLNQEARRDALVSDVGFAAGGLVLATGLFLLVRPFSSGRTTQAARSVDVHAWIGRGAGLAARW